MGQVPLPKEKSEHVNGSIGNQQKVQFLAAMLHNPDILIMDEPFSGLDPVKRQQGRYVARLTLDNDPEAIWLEQLPGVHVTKRRQDYIEMQFEANLSPNQIVANKRKGP